MRYTNTRLLLLLLLLYKYTTTTTTTTTTTCVSPQPHSVGLDFNSGPPSVTFSCHYFQNATSGDRL